MQVRCNGCGKTADIPDYTETSVAPPKGWRKIYVQIDRFTSDDGSLSTSESEGLHTCPTCNEELSVDEDLDALLACLAERLTERAKR